MLGKSGSGDVEMALHCDFSKRREPLIKGHNDRQSAAAPHSRQFVRRDSQSVSQYVSQPARLAVS